MSFKMSFSLFPREVAAVYFLWQLEQNFCPRLVAFGEEPQLLNPNSGSSSSNSRQTLLMKALPFFQALLSCLDRLTNVLENLLLQLGSLCAEHTRKATILQGLCLFDCRQKSNKLLFLSQACSSFMPLFIFQALLSISYA